MDRVWKIDNRHMNVVIETEAAQLPEKEYINGILVAALRRVNISTRAANILLVFSRPKRIKEKKMICRHCYSNFQGMASVDTG